MLALAPKFELLRNKGIDRRRDLPKTMERRKAVHQETLKKWKAIKNERGKKIEPIEKRDIKKPTTTQPPVKTKIPAEKP
jgi:hypothetical protein